PPASTVVVLIVSPELMCKTGGMAPENTRWNAVGSKTCVFGPAALSFSRRAFHPNSSSACFTVPSIASPCTRPSNLPHSLPSGRVAVMCKRSPSTVPSSFNSFKVPVSLLPSAFSSTRAAANSSPNRTRCRFHRPVTSAAQANTGRNNKSMVLVMQVIRCRAQIVPRERLKAGTEACETLEMAQVLEQSEKGQAFRALHERGKAFIIPNPWDAGTARLLAHLGFEALATTSAGYAFS